MRECMRTIAIVCIPGLLLASCANDGFVGPEEKVTAGEVTAGEVHNLIVGAYLERCPRRGEMTREARVDAYVETARAVCEERRFDYEPDRERMRGFLAMAERWRAEGVWDIYDPASTSPDEVIDRFVEAGVIPAGYGPYLHRLFEGLRSQGIEPRGPLTCEAAPCDEMEEIRIFLRKSCELWYDREGPVPIEFADDIERADWWKKAAKYVCVGACDGLAGMAAYFATAGNPFATGFFGGIASVAAYDAFDERGW